MVFPKINTLCTPFCVPTYGFISPSVHITTLNCTKYRTISYLQSTASEHVSSSSNFVVKKKSFPRTASENMRFENAPKCQVVEIGLEESRLVRPRGRDGCSMTALKQEEYSLSASSSSTIDTMSTFGASSLFTLAPKLSDLFFFCSAENDLCREYPNRASGTNILDSKATAAGVPKKIAVVRLPVQDKSVGLMMKDTEQAISYEETRNTHDAALIYDRCRLGRNERQISCTSLNKRERHEKRDCYEKSEVNLKNGDKYWESTVTSKTQAELIDDLVRAQNEELNMLKSQLQQLMSIMDQEFTKKN